MYKIILTPSHAIRQTERALLIQFTTEYGKFTYWIPKSSFIINNKLNLLIHSDFLGVLKTKASKKFNTNKEGIIRYRP